MRLVALDSTRGRKARGELDAERLTWLDAALREAQHVPTIVAMHHPPFDVGVAAIDTKPLRGREALERVVRRHPQIVRIIAGHVHFPTAHPFGGTLATTARSTSPQLVIDSATGASYGLRLEPGGYAMHRWNGFALATTTETPGAVRLRAVS